MDDPSRVPKDGDRRPLRDRIRRAVSDGRISPADGEIRLRNVDSAQSIGELGLIVRDLDQLESALAPAAARSAPSAGYATPAATIAAAAGRSTRAWVPVLVAVIVLAVLGAGAGALLIFSSGGGSKAATPLGDPVPFTASASPTVPAGGRESPGVASYGLSARGVAAFIATYRARFGTSRVVSATFYGDYVVVQVPAAGGRRHAGWIYRPGSGFTRFGGTAADFPGARAVDLTKLDVAALMRNLARAARVLNVEKPEQRYVTIDYRPKFDPAPNVNIYLTNQFGEGGYLATRLDGRIERAFAFTEAG